jgi:hypothetical protein
VQMRGPLWQIQTSTMRLQNTLCGCEKAVPIS